jgi:hypothetical protein
MVPRTLPYGDLMSILVDQARWGWRGTTWCHLVSDSHLDELHAFAGELGCRRVGFQGDHYDIDVDTREIAIELGAVVCDSRELVRRLKAAGLRLRPSVFDKWELDYRIDGGIEDEAWDVLLERHTHLRRVEEAELAEEGFHRHAIGCFVLKRNSSEAVVVHGEGSSTFATDDPSAGLFARRDHRGIWAVESFWPPPTSNE